MSISIGRFRLEAEVPALPSDLWFSTQYGLTHVKIVFPNEREQDKMHKFFEMFNFKRKQAQGVDRSFPPMPDIYQGGPKPNVDAIKRYIYSIENAFDGDSQVVEIPSGANWKLHKFEV